MVFGTLPRFSIVASSIVYNSEQYGQCKPAMNLYSSYSLMNTAFITGLYDGGGSVLSWSAGANSWRYRLQWRRQRPTECSTMVSC